MSEITFTKEETDFIVKQLQRYFDDELDRELGQFEAQFLLDFFAENIGVYYYNQGLRDAQTIVATRMEGITETIDEIEKITPLNK